MKHRPDIDGLRAVAILAVVAAHIGAQHARGGFFGVDVFFVISGYLISGIVFADIEAQKFSFAAFYERRVRRIVPAFFVVLMAVFALAYIYMLPVEMNGFAKSLVAATFGVSNIYFWTLSGYFDSASAYMPLLHTWSLSVEEQFYVIFPILLLLGYRFCRPQLKVLVVALFLASLLANILGAFYYPDARFYLTPNRAWELLAGALITLNIVPEIRERSFRNAASVAGLFLIVLSFVCFSPETPYLGVAALLPCLGATLIIAAGCSGESIVGKALSIKPMLFVGLISYSLYLWHWPVIVFHRMGFIPCEGLSPRMEKTVLIAVCFAFATLSWKYVETPFRKKRFSRRALFIASFVGLTGFVVMGNRLAAADGLAERFAPEVSRAASFLDYNPDEVARVGTCFITDKFSYADFDPSVCMRQDKEKKNYLLIGDSHAAHLSYGLLKTFPEVNLMQATASGCKPTLDHPVGTSDACVSIMDFVYQTYLPHQKVDVLLIEAAWKEEDLASIPAILARAKEDARSVILFGPMVQYDAPLPRILAISLFKKEPGYPFLHRRDDLREVDHEMAKIAQENNVRYISFYDLLCGPNTCVTSTTEGAPVLYDYGHLTKEGSLLTAQELAHHGLLP